MPRRRRGRPMSRARMAYDARDWRWRRPRSAWWPVEPVAATRTATTSGRAIATSSPRARRGIDGATMLRATSAVLARVASPRRGARDDAPKRARARRSRAGRGGGSGTRSLRGRAARRRRHQHDDRRALGGRSPKAARTREATAIRATAPVTHGAGVRPRARRATITTPAARLPTDPAAVLNSAARERLASNVAFARDGDGGGGGARARARPRATPPWNLYSAHNRAAQ